MEIEKCDTKTESLKTIDEKVTVIIPVFNVEKYIKQCLDSIISQTYTNLEIICVDDGSTDHSLEIIQFYSKKDSRIKVLTQEHLGPSAARNLALDNSTGKYISFVDSDDFLQWNAYEILTLVAEENDLDMIIFGGNTYPYGEGDNWIKEIQNTKYKLYKNCSAGTVIFQEKASRPFLWLHFIKRELFEKPNKIRFDEEMEIGEDQLFQFCYVPRAKSVMVIEDKLYNYRIWRNGSLMQLYKNRKIQKVESHLTLVEKIVEYWNKEHYLEVEEDNFITWAVNFLYFSMNELPMTYRKKYANKALELFEKSGFHDYLIAESEKEHYQEMREWSRWMGKETDEIEKLKKQIEQDKYEIQETIKSRAFRIGRKLTKKNQQLDLNIFDEL